MGNTVKFKLLENQAVCSTTTLADLAQSMMLLSGRLVQIIKIDFTLDN